MDNVKDRLDVIKFDKSRMKVLGSCVEWSKYIVENKQNYIKISWSYGRDEL